jgi:hypothetical protein
MPKSLVLFQRLDSAARGSVLLALLALVENFQLVIIIGLVSSLVPIKLDPFNLDIFPVYQYSIKPNRQMLIYHTFIVTCVLGHRRCL